MGGVANDHYLQPERHFGGSLVHLFIGGVIFSGEILMTLNALIQITLYLVTLLLLAKPLGVYMANVYENRPVLMNRLLAPVELALYR